MSTASRIVLPLIALAMAVPAQAIQAQRLQPSRFGATTRTPEIVLDPEQLPEIANCNRSLRFNLVKGAATIALGSWLLYEALSSDSGHAPTRIYVILGGAGVGLVGTGLDFHRRCSS